MRYNRDRFNRSPFNRSGSTEVLGFVKASSNCSTQASAQVLTKASGKMDSAFSLETAMHRVQLLDLVQLHNGTAIHVHSSPTHNLHIDKMEVRVSFTSEGAKVNTTKGTIKTATTLTSLFRRVRDTKSQALVNNTSLTGEAHVIAGLGKVLRTKASCAAKAIRVQQSISAPSVDTSCNVTTGTLLTAKLKGADKETQGFFNRMAFNRLVPLSLLDGLRIETSVQAMGVQASISKAVLQSNTSLEAKVLKVTPQVASISCNTSLTATASRKRLGQSAMHSEANMYIQTHKTFTDVVNQPAREFHTYIEVYFDGLDKPPVILQPEDINDYELLEEIRYDNETPLGGISSNTFNLTIADVEHLFNPGNKDTPYKNKLVPSVAIRPFIGISVLGQIEYECLGTFFTEEWLPDTTFPEVQVPCRDRLSIEGQIDLAPVRLQRDVTTLDLFRLVFKLMGLAADDYQIDPLAAANVPYAWLPKGKAIDVLQILSEACGCFVFVDRDNKYQVQSIKKGLSQSHITDQDQIITYSNSAKYGDVYSGIAVDLHRPSLKPAQDVLTLNNIPLEAGVTILENYEFNNAPIANIEAINIYGSPEVKILYYQADPYTITMHVQSPTAASVDISVVGSGIDINPQAVRQNNASMEAIIGQRVLEVHNYLMQDAAFAQPYRNRLLSMASKPDAAVHTTIRGNPKLTINRYMVAEDATQDVQEQRFLTTRCRLLYDGGIDMTLEGLKLEVI